jgi:hypothetical protein
MRNEWIRNKEARYRSARKETHEVRRCIGAA